MLHKKLIASVTAFCLAAATLAFELPQPAEAASLNTLQSQQKKIQKELNSIKAELSSLKQDIAKEQQYQDALTQQIALNTQKVLLIHDQMDQLNTEMGENQEKLDTASAQIEAKEGEIALTSDQCRQRIRVMYMAGETSSLELLLQSDSFSDLLTSVEMIKAISNYDAELMHSLRMQKTDLQNQQSQAERIQEDIAQQQDALKVQQAEMEKTNAELNAAYEQSKEAMHDIETAKAIFEKDAAAKTAQAKQIEAEISAEIKRRQEENEKKQQQQNNGKPSKFNDGRFIRPTNNGYYVSSGYGPRWGSFHCGMDLTAGGCYGANIYAAASGTVITASTHWSYGNYVVIDHGGGYSTLYAHCSQLNVGVGQHVKQGQVIAKIGSTGQSTGPHLHFEVRINGRHTNPAQYVSY